MDYQEALDWIMSFWDPARSKEQERAQRPLKVLRMRRLLELLGSPHLKYPSVLVAGTKGKGSTVAFMAEGLRAAGYRVGRYTQPHLMDWCERTWVDGRWIRPEEVAALAQRIRPVVESLQAGEGKTGGLTTYEVGTALTLSYFAEKQVDVAVLEIGVGGRLDALNAVEPVLSAVTSISFDHVDVLGNNLEEIAAEKAGIFRPGRPAVMAPQPPEAEVALRRSATGTGARLYAVGRCDDIRHIPCLFPHHGVKGDPVTSPSPWDGRRAGEGGDPAGADWCWTGSTDPDAMDIYGPYGSLRGLRVALLGDHQRDNATVAAASLQLLREQGFRVADEAIRRGLAKVEWPGRIQRLQKEPAVVADAAHNRDSVQRLLETVRRSFPYRRLVLVFGASSDKDISGMAQVLGPAADLVVATSSGHRRAADLENLAAQFAPYTTVHTETEPPEALRRALALAGREDLVLVTGSVFLVGRAIQVMGPGGRNHKDTENTKGHEGRKGIGNSE